MTYQKKKKINKKKLNQTNNKINRTQNPKKAKNEKKNYIMRV